MEILFWPIDIIYRIKNGEIIFYLYGRTKDGESICVIDANYLPYIYAEENLYDAISSFKNVIKIEKTKRKLFEKEINVLKVYFKNPQDIFEIQRKIKEGIFEHDVPLTKKYLIDKAIVPFLLTKAKGSFIAEKIFKAEEIKNESEEAIEPKILAIDIETYSPVFEIKQKDNPIIMISLAGKDFKKVLTWKNFPTENKEIEFLKSEGDMLLRAFELIKKYDPDVLVGYNSDSFDLPYIKSRANKYRISFDYGIEKSEIRLVGKSARITGLCHIDLYRFILMTISKSLETEFYDLDSVAKEILGKQKVHVDLNALPHAWDSATKDLEKFCEYNLQDALLTYQLAMKLWPNILELVKIVGQMPSDATRASFSQLVEWYIIKQAVKEKEIIPRKPSFEEQLKRQKVKYKGAFVVEPKPGLYNNIAVLDFRSLYPSIIATHNISLGTLFCQCCKENVIDEKWFCKKQKGFLSAIIEDLITRRARIKEILKKSRDPILLARSETLKILANAFYGYFGYALARWYSFDCASAITAFGRKYITSLMSEAQEKDFSVIYGDTDSIFLSLGAKTKEDVERFVYAINKRLPGLMELELEDFYPRGLFVAVRAGERGAKKKYALLKENGQIKIKGFEAIRRNAAPIARETQEKIIEIILKEMNFPKALNFARKVISDLRKNLVPIEKVTIVTQLRKEIIGYAAYAPHVQAARRAERAGIKIFPGALISWIVARGAGKISDRVRLPNEIEQSQYDGEYYVTNQVLPSINGIFEAIGIKIDEREGLQKFIF